jgi:predicted ATPase
VFEDLHWADEPTLLLLQHIGQMLSTTPILLIGTYRDVELEVTRPFAKTLEAMLRQKQATRISLRRLAVDGVEGMLAALSGQTPPPSLARVVFAETEGNPFFVEEIFRHLAEEGKLFDETGKWRSGLRADQLEVPEGVRLVLGRRLDRLGVDARRVLTTAAVIGRSFSLRLLEALENQRGGRHRTRVCGQPGCAGIGVGAPPLSGRRRRRSGKNRELSDHRRPKGPGECGA